MNRKNAFSYIIWFLYSMAVCVSLLCMTAGFGKQVGQADYVGFGIGGFWLILCGLITFFVHKLLKNSSGKSMDRKQAIVTESLIVIILFVIGIVLRITGMDGVEKDATYYELAKVVEGQSVPVVVHGAVYIYLQLLHFVYWIFGNKYLAGIWLQIILQVFASGFFYLTVRKMAGVVSAIIMLGFAMLSPFMMSEALLLSPEMLFLAVYALILYVCAKGICDRKGLIACIVTGVLISVVCYLDIMGISLLVMIVAGILIVQNKTNDSLKRRLIGAVLCVISCIACFIVLMLVDSLASAKGMSGVILAWWKVFIPSGFDVTAVLKLDAVSKEQLILVILMAVGAFSFWCDKQKERQSIWSLTAFTLALLQCFGMTTAEVSGNLQLYIIGVALAGIGVTGMFAKETIVNRFLEEGKLEETLEAMSIEFMDEADKDKADMKKDVVVVDIDAEAEVDAEEQTDVPQDEPPQVKLIENPLPLPKKHVKRVMDFDVEMNDDMYKFDVDVAEDDDFDI